MIDFRNALNLAGAASGWRTIQVNDGGAAIDARLSGVIYDNNQTFGWGLKKTGAGTLELAADSSYTRSTIVSEGTLIASGRMLATSEVSVLSGGKFVYRSALGALARPVSIEGGTFYYNSSSAFAGSLNFESGTLGGSGNLGNTAITVGAGRTINPGDGVGTLRSGSEIWADGGTYVWEINNLSGAKGAASGWDFLDINGSLNLTAGDDGFIIELTALGSLAGWNPHQTQSWIIATASAGIIGFDPGSLRVVTDSFLDEGTRGGGVFAVALMGNSLALTYTAVPEPAVLSLVLASVAGAYAARRRFRGRFAG
jgi:autotransporter-associated beta strand protein